tara:strand:+ start:2977 stop:4245 length:1269 start_codon:yes stop_codon:yes gene_type:complete
MLLIYSYLINIFFPIIVFLIFVRKLLSKEDKNRYREKIFSSSLNIVKNHKKKLIWFHTASIGELKSIIPLIKELNKKDELEFLVTTVTVSSANLIKKELFNQNNIYHRFFPIDKPSLIKKFLNGWSPFMTIFVDSEIWPNFILEIKKRNIPLILLNGRITKKTFLKWSIFKNVAQKVFRSFDLCLTSSNESKKYLEKLKAKNVKYIGNLKFTSENEINNQDIKNKKILNNNKFWCAVSTHKEEDIFCIKTHLEIKKNHKNIISIIIPRHINRAQSIKSSCEKLNLKSQILSYGEFIEPNKEIIIINSYGVTSSYLSFCKSVFIGKSMIKRLQSVGGQNPIEAAKLGCKIYYGPYVYNFQEMYELLNKFQISEIIYNEIELSNKISADLNNKEKIKDEKIKIINDLGKQILNDTYLELNKMIN